MSSRPSRIKPIKCRSFDPNTGEPTEHHRRDPTKCEFAHPGDPEWGRAFLSKAKYVTKDTASSHYPPAPSRRDSNTSDHAWGNDSKVPTGPRSSRATRDYSDPPSSGSAGQDDRTSSYNNRRTSDSGWDTKRRGSSPKPKASASHDRGTTWDSNSPVLKTSNSGWGTITESNADAGSTWGLPPSDFGNTAASSSGWGESADNVAPTWGASSSADTAGAFGSGWDLSVLEQPKPKISSSEKRSSESKLPTASSKWPKPSTVDGSHQAATSSNDPSSSSRSRLIVDTATPGSLPPSATVSSSVSASANSEHNPLSSSSRLPTLTNGRNAGPAHVNSIPTRQPDAMDLDIPHTPNEPAFTPSSPRDSKHPTTTHTSSKTDRHYKLKRLVKNISVVVRLYGDVAKVNEELREISRLNSDLDLESKAILRRREDEIKAKRDQLTSTLNHSFERLVRDEDLKWPLEPPVHLLHQQPTPTLPAALAPPTTPPDALVNLIATLQHDIVAIQKRHSELWARQPVAKEFTVSEDVEMADTDASSDPLNRSSSPLPPISEKAAGKRKAEEPAASSEMLSSSSTLEPGYHKEQLGKLRRRLVTLEERVEETENSVVSWGNELTQSIEMRINELGKTKNKYIASNKKADEGYLSRLTKLEEDLQSGRERVLLAVKNAEAVEQEGLRLEQERQQLTSSLTKGKKELEKLLRGVKAQVVNAPATQEHSLSPELFEHLKASLLAQNQESTEAYQEVQLEAHRRQLAEIHERIIQMIGSLQPTVNLQGALAERVLPELFREGKLQTPRHVVNFHPGQS